MKNVLSMIVFLHVLEIVKDFFYFSNNIIIIVVYSIETLYCGIIHIRYCIKV